MQEMIAQTKLQEAYRLLGEARVEISELNKYAQYLIEQAKTTEPGGGAKLHTCQERCRGLTETLDKLSAAHGVLVNGDLGKRLISALMQAPVGWTVRIGAADQAFSDYIVQFGPVGHATLIHQLTEHLEAVVRERAAHEAI